MVVVSAYMCPTCKSIIYSRARHDFHWCPCGDTGVDGGFDYNKVSYKKEPPIPVKVTVNTTRWELFKDWDQRIDKYGVIGNNNMEEYSIHDYKECDGGDKNMYQVIGPEKPIPSEKNDEDKKERFMISFEYDEVEWFAIPVKYTTLSELIEDFTGICEINFLKRSFEFMFCGVSFDSRDFFSYNSETGELTQRLPHFHTLNDWLDGRSLFKYKTISSIERKR